MNSIVHSTMASTPVVLHQETYNYDAANNLTSKLVNSVATNYTYDAIDQLTSEISNATLGVHDLYTYDHNGNRATKQSAVGGLTQYTYDHADKLTYVAKSSGNVSYTYDDCGRPTQIGSRMLTWDYEDRLTNLNAGSLNTNYGYNGVGSRTSKSNANESRSYKRNGVGVTAPVLSDGVSTMVPGIAEKTNGGVSTVLTDRLGSMKAYANAGNVTDAAEYDAFGNVQARTGTSPTQKGFASGSGYQEDGESGYKLLGHRYYDPETGRFLSRDPAQNGGNWYGYCANNPLKRIDSNGLYFLPTQGQCNLAAGFCDTVSRGGVFTFLTGKSVAQWLREMMNGGIDCADKNSEAYWWGQNLGEMVGEAAGEFGGAPEPRLSSATATAATDGAEAAGSGIGPGSAGGPSAGQGFSQATKNGARAGSDGVCPYCRSEFDPLDTSASHVDHIIPRSQGGNATPANSQVTCAWCNLSKGPTFYPRGRRPGFEGDWPPSHWNP